MSDRNPKENNNYTFQTAADFAQLEIIKKELPAREGVYADFPAGLASALASYLNSRGIDRLYIHQAEAFSLAGAGADLVITTSTASGKTLAFLLPVLQELIRDPLARAIFVYPTKALAADQLRVLSEVLDYLGLQEGLQLSAGVYDGDTLPAERTRIRKSANIILTNPEMLNSAFLPNHSRYGFDAVFSHLRFVVVDELHSYKGAFGAHMANIFRRLKRVCDYYHARPQFLCSSATIANPQELAAKICGREFALVDRDGSPAGSRSYHILQPPAIKGTNDQVYGRIPAAAIASDMIPVLVEEERHFIAFGRSRRNVEVILKEARDKMDAAGFLGRGGREKVSGYRGGYTPMERKKIEKDMIQGKLLGLVSTNALELGIDIGSLDTTLIVGYPGSRASFWQQTGRSGRKKTAAENFLLLENEPFDQYIAVDPDWLFGQSCENAIVDPNNLLIELAHVRAAAAELPLSLDDLALFPDLGEILPVLMKAAEVKALSGRFAWAGPAFPAGDYSLRNMDKSRYKLLVSGRTITEMDETQAFHELYPGAVYLHEGELYEVTKLDLVSRTAEGRPFAGDYYTVPQGEKDTRILGVRREEEIGLTEMHFGDINLNDIVMAFKKLQFHNHQNLGYVDLTLPLQKDYDTESTWLKIPQQVVRVFRENLSFDESRNIIRNNYFDGLLHAVESAAMLVTMTAKEDIGSVTSGNALIPNGEPEEEVFLYIYDRYEGGLGYADKIYDLMPQILERARRLVKGCSCKDGCPACVGDYTLDKGLVAWALDSFFEESEPPAVNKTVKTPKQTAARKHFSLGQLDTFRGENHWQDLCREVTANGESGGAFLSSVERVQVSGSQLVLYVKSAFLKEWSLLPENHRSLENIIRYHVICPADMELKIFCPEADETWQKEKKQKEEKLARKYENIRGNTEDTE